MPCLTTTPVHLDYCCFVRETPNVGQRSIWKKRIEWNIQSKTSTPVHYTVLFIHHVFLKKKQQPLLGKLLRLGFVWAFLALESQYTSRKKSVGSLKPFFCSAAFINLTGTFLACFPWHGVCVGTVGFIP